MRNPSGAAPVLISFLTLVVLLSACAQHAEGTPGSDGVLAVGAIPDQDPEKLQRLYGRLAQRLAVELEVDVEYVPVTDYAAAVTLFRTGDLDLVWFGGLTGVQARAQTPGARALAQREIDADFRSIFIAHRDAGIAPINDVAGLASLAGHRITFGSESSTSGRLMPQYFLREAGLGDDAFDGEIGFSGSHDATIDLVESGSYEVGALNQQVWESRTGSGEVDMDVVTPIFRTPTYYDYHWLLRPDADERFGEGFGNRVRDVLLSLDRSDPQDAEILTLFGAHRFIETANNNYAAIEEVAEELGLLRG